MHVLAQDTAGWQAGYTIGVIVVIAIVALVVPILVLAHLIGKQAKEIDECLQESVANTAALGIAGDDRVGRDDHRRAPAWPHQAGGLRMILALSDTTENWWWGALAAGAVVLLAVVALLTILVLLVNTIDKRTMKIRETLQQAADNTADSALIAETAARVDDVLAEGLEHHLFLGRVLDKVRT